MDTFFYVALLQIIGINIILSGDNAVVIALACRSLPPRQQKIGVILGAGAAVALRVLFTIFITYLLATPYLKLAGGVLLLWIGFKLMTEEETKEDDIKASSHLMGAIRTIMIADAVMSLDNVIAVAAAAKGRYELLIIGLVISIPLVVYGATLMLVLIRRFPFIVTLGAALIGYIGGEVIVSDPAVDPWVNANAAWLHIVAPLLGAVLVVDSGKLLGHAPARTPASVTEAAEASAGMFGLRGLAVMAGGLVLARAPLIVSFAASLFGYAVADGVLPPETHASGAAALLRAVEPIAGTAVALLIAEAAGRVLGFRTRGRS